MVSISYYCRKGSKTIYCSVSKGREFQVKRSTKQKLINPLNWNTETNKVSRCKEEIFANSINSFLVKNTAKINKGVEELVKYGLKLNELNVSTLLDSFEGSNKSVKKLIEFSFTENLEEYIKKLKSGKILKPDTLKSYSLMTIKSYGTLLSNLKKFEKSKGAIKPNEVNYDLYIELLSFFREKGLVDNTIGNFIKNFKSVINNYFIKILKIEFKNFNPSEWKRVSSETLNTYLTLPELYKLLNFDLSNYPKMYDEVRDAYCFIAFTCGIRIGDYMKLSKHHLTTKMVKGEKVQYLEFKQSKTGNGVKAPLNKISLDLLEKHKGFPKLISEIKANKILKKIAQMCGFDSWVFNESKTKKERKYNLLTYHSARRSFCTNAWDKKTDLIQIMKMSGHKSPDILLKYIGKSLDEYADRMLETDYFKAVNDIENTIKLKAI
jgi:integrase